jgi:hypothetical protein
MSMHGRLGPILLLLLSATAVSGKPSDTSPCRSAAYRTFDFTKGTWNVTDPQGKSRGVATVGYDLDGCAVVESWSAPDGHSGTNVDAYSSDDKHWHRLFVDNKGHVHEFTGTSTGTLIRYEGLSKGPNGEDVLNQLDISARSSNVMVQVWQQSRDRGKTWNVVFRDLYTRT